MAQARSCRTCLKLSCVHFLQISDDSDVSPVTLVRGLPTSIGHAESAQRSELLLPPISFYLGPSRLTPKSSLGELWGCGVSRRLLIVRDEQKMSKRHDADGRAVPPCGVGPGGFLPVCLSGILASDNGVFGTDRYSPRTARARGLLGWAARRTEPTPFDETLPTLNQCPGDAGDMSKPIELPAVCPLSACCLPAVNVLIVFGVCKSAH